MSPMASRQFITAVMSHSRPSTSHFHSENNDTWAEGTGVSAFSRRSSEHDGNKIHYMAVYTRRLQG